MKDYKRDLTIEEKEKPYAKYYYREPAPPAPERLAAMEKPMDPSMALPIERINDLLAPGYHEAEAGWCVLPNGAGYAANHVPMPGVTVDMVDWWMAWHSLGDMRYKLWWPDGHYAIDLSEEDRQKVLDPNRSLTEKYQGLTHHVTEFIGGPGVEKIAIHFMRPEEVGFDMSRFKHPAVGTVVTANAVERVIDPPDAGPEQGMPAFMLHFIREIPGGIEYRSRFWLGYHVVERKPRLLLSEGVRIPDFVLAGLGLHNVREYANLASFLPQIYQEEQGIVS